MLATLVFSKKSVIIAMAFLALAALAAFAMAQSASASHSICTMEFAPVCGQDGKTYSNRCQTMGHTLVKHNGPCTTSTPAPSHNPVPTFNPAPTFVPVPSLPPIPSFRPLPTWQPPVWWSWTWNQDSGRYRSGTKYWSW